METLATDPDGPSNDVSGVAPGPSQRAVAIEGVCPWTKEPVETDHIISVAVLGSTSGRLLHSITGATSSGSVRIWPHENGPEEE